MVSSMAANSEEDIPTRSVSAVRLTGKRYLLLTHNWGGVTNYHHLKIMLLASRSLRRILYRSGRRLGTRTTHGNEIICNDQF